MSQSGKSSIENAYEALGLVADQWFEVELEALDGNPITKRTGKAKVSAETNRLPIEGAVQIFIYKNETCDSPGVQIATDGIERIGNEIKFFDDAKRPFKITINKNKTVSN